ncbi:MAG: CBS domain-containing protein [Thaumarchaeota archaeon]|nr:CBS domain-containing protein [Nitrososphaerota archaeon]
MTKWECYRCNYIFEGDATPEECPNCHYALTFWLEHVETKPPTIRNLVKTDFLTIDANESAWDAARTMKEHSLGNILVTINGSPVGIVTERDILNKVAAEDLPASKVLVRKIMSAPLITVPADTPLADAIKLMAKHHIRTLVVTDQGKTIGILNQRSIIGDQFKVARALQE